MTCIIYIAGLFEDEDIIHARETIHYLISKQGDKATHFQVIVPLFKLLKIIGETFLSKSMANEGRERLEA